MDGPAARSLTLTKDWQLAHHAGDENPSMGQGYTSAATIGASPVSLYVYLPTSIA